MNPATYIQGLSARAELIGNALGAVLNGLRTGAAVPARDVAAVLIGIPLAIWITFLLARPRRTRVRRTTGR